MTPPRPPRWRHGIPAFLAGVALALGIQVSAGLLLYGGPGFLPALSVVLATASLALGAGLAAPPGVSWPGSGGAPPEWSELTGGPLLEIREVERVRRRWLGLLLAFTAAAFFAGGWELFRGFGARGLTQGVGLALMVASPMFAGGRLLASPAMRLVGEPGGDAGNWGGGSWALAGAAAGFLLLAHLLFPALSPTAVLLFCVVATSGGALVHGWLLDEVAQVEVEPRSGGQVRLRWRRPRPGSEGVAWLDRGGESVVRGGDGEPTHPADRALEMEILPLLSEPSHVVAVGWRSIPMALAAGPAARIDVVDPDPERVEWLVSELVGEEGNGRVTNRALSFDAWLASGPSSVDLVVASGSLLHGGEAPSASAWAALADRLGPGGVVVVHGLVEGRAGDGLLAPLEAASGVFGLCAAYVGPAPGPAEGSAARAGFLVCGDGDPGTFRPPRTSDALPERVGSFLKVLPQGAGAAPDPEPGAVAGGAA